MMGRKTFRHMEKSAFHRPAYLHPSVKGKFAGVGFLPLPPEGDYEFVRELPRKDGVPKETQTKQLLSPVAFHLMQP